MHQLLTNRAQSGIRDQIRHPFRKIKEKERLVSLPKALFRADWPSSHVRGQSPSKRSVWFCVSDKCKDVRREWDCGWFIGWGCAGSGAHICRSAQEGAWRQGGGRVLFFSSRHALHQHRPAGNLCLPKNSFFALFQKGSLWSPASGIKVQSKKMKNMLRTKKESLAINDMWREKIFQKWTKFWRIRWTFLLCFSEILYIASAMSSWSALYQNGNKGRKRRKNQVVASLTSLSQQSRINHHASPSRQLMFNCTSVCRRELWSRRRRRSPRWWRWGGTQHGPAWHLLLPGLSYCWGKASKVRKRMFNSLYFIGNWVPGEWFKLGLLWVFCHPSRGAVCYRT